MKISLRQTTIVGNVCRNTKDSIARHSATTLGRGSVSVDMSRRVVTLLAIAAVVMHFTANLYAVERKVKSIDAVVEMPTAGVRIDVEPSLSSAQTAWGDLAASDDIKLGGVSWKGTFDRDANNYEIFKAGYSYVCSMTFYFTNDPGKTQYYANYVTTKNGWEVRDFSITVNGQPTDLEKYSAIRSPIVTFTYTVPGVITDSVSINAANQFHQQEIRRREMNKCYDHTLADAHLLENNPQDVYVYNADGEFLPYVDKPINFWSLTSVIYEGYGNAQRLTQFVEGTFYHQNVSNVWISTHTNAVDFITAIYNAMFGRNQVAYNKVQLYASSSWGIRKSSATIYVPDSQVAAVKDYLKNIILQPVFTVKAYKGDVYEAQRNNAAHDICDKHLYTAAITAADRVINYANCDSPSHYYYSCTYCGKIERNPNHVFSGVEPGPKVITQAPLTKYGSHIFFNEVASDDNYIGVNAAGQHVYWVSCIYCHHGWGYCINHPTDRDLVGWSEENAKAYRGHVTTEVELFVKEALADVKNIANTFTMPDRATARISADPELQSGVNYALCVNLVDKPLLGDDYTAAATRRQLLSIAIRLAEELTCHPVPLADVSPYADATDSCALKSASMNLTADFATSRLDADRTATRQEMATVIYRALRYVEQHSDYSYSDFTSRLDNYSDCARLQTWAVEPMAFMEAMGLLTPTSTTTLTPDSPCSIEVALCTAYKSTFAQLIGWAQLPPLEKYNHIGFLGVTPDRATFSHTELENSRRVWITGPRIGPNGLSAPVLDPISGLNLFGEAKYFYHVRQTGGDPAVIDNRITSPAKTTTTATKKSTIRRTTTKKKTISRTTR